jgi:hypothetical protein
VKASHLRGYFDILIARLLAILERISRMLDQKAKSPGDTPNPPNDIACYD